MSLSVFISHSSKDVTLVETLVDLLRVGLGLTEKDIRCTSLVGYGFEVGTLVDERLRKEINSFKAFLGIITPYSLQSAYVLFELGARWGVELPLAPLLARGATAASLEGPLSKLVAADCTSRDQMHRFLAELGSKLGKSVSNASVYENALEKLCLAARERASLTSVAWKTESGQKHIKLTDDPLTVMLKFTIPRGGHFHAEDFARATRISDVRAVHYAETLMSMGLLSDGYDASERRYFHLTSQGRAEIVAHNLDR